jgi:uncharacterized membrane protein YhaH (DUF805 family)
VINLAVPSGGATDGNSAVALARLLGALLSLAIAIAFLWALFAIDVKRCHDREKTGWFSLISLVPILNIWTFVELGCLDGKPGDNRYGPSPKAAGQGVFA